MRKTLVRQNILIELRISLPPPPPLFPRPSNPCMWKGVEQCFQNTRLNLTNTVTYLQIDLYFIIAKQRQFVLFYPAAVIIGNRWPGRSIIFSFFIILTLCNNQALQKKLFGTDKNWRSEKVTSENKMQPIPQNEERRRYMTWTGDFAERDKCKPVLPRLSLAGNLEKPLMSLYRTEWRERGYRLWLLLHVLFRIWDCSVTRDTTKGVKISL
jgi:hypothetical protein